MFKILATALFTVVLLVTDQARAVEPVSLTWHIVSDREMSKICRNHGLTPSCAGMASWDKELQLCVIWTRSPRSENDVERWRWVHHELRHCRDGHFHQ
jgi:hypothetical protein